MIHAFHELPPETRRFRIVAPGWSMKSPRRVKEIMMHGRARGKAHAADQGKFLSAARACFRKYFLPHENGTTNMFDLPSVQAALVQQGLDGWLLYDFRG